MKANNMTTLTDNRLTKIEAVKINLTAYYDIRFNSITGKLELKTKNGEDKFSAVTPNKIKELRKLLSDEYGLKVTEREIYKAFDANTFNPRQNSDDNKEIEMYIETIYEVRFNSIKQKPEYKYIGDESWLAVDKYFINSLNREITAIGLKCSVAKLNELFFSNFAEKVNPIQEYFRDLPDYKIGTDYISELAATIDMVNKDYWCEYFRKWIVAVVANVFIEEKCCNHTMLVITGKQGAYKTTWLESICPPKLRQYLYTGKIDPENKDVQTMLSECFLINIDDQLRELNKKDENALKNLITVNNVKYRRPYDVFIQEYPHLASFMGSINGNDFLTDPTGSRRFLPFEALTIHIDKTKELDMDKVWSQAYYLFRTGFRYWFSSEEVDELNKRNADFAVISAEEQLFLKYFRKPNPEETPDFMQPATILSILQTKTDIKITQKRLGEALSKLGFTKTKKRINGYPTHGYYIKYNINDAL